MWEFNLVVTMATEGRYRHLIEELSALGEFHSTEFLGVILGRVEDRLAFFERLQERRSAVQGFQDLRRVIPIDRVFSFHLEEFAAKAKGAVLPYIDDLAGRAFYVRLERRGFKGRIISPEVERDIDAFIEQNLAMKGAAGRIDFESPEAIVVVETIGDRCGVGLLTREMIDRYDFIRVD